MQIPILAKICDMWDIKEELAKKYSISIGAIPYKNYKDMQENKELIKRFNI